MASSVDYNSAQFHQRHEFDFSQENFARISRLIYERAGISLSMKKQEMVYNRLSRRLRALGLTCFSDYLEILIRGDSEEWSNFIGALTTHLTSFFRENYHFPILARHMAERSVKGKVFLWSCAASTGEEAYSMAITAAEQFNTLFPPVSILATDVDRGVLDTARKGVYPLERVLELPESIVHRYFLRGSGICSGSVKVRPELQQMITYMQLNLLAPVWPMKERFDVIFCRNVMIYFDRHTQERVLAHCTRHLKPDGLFFAGHSENLYHAACILEPCGKTVYRPHVPQGDSKQGVVMGGECYA